MLTRSQKFAKLVYERVSAHGDRSKDEKDKYGAMAQKLPVLVRTAGLAQAIAFLEAKSKSKGGEMNGHLLKDLSGVLGLSSEEFVRKCREVELIGYLRLTQDVLAALLWFKRFSVSVLEDK